jgi:hypothetical protein
VKTGHPRPRSDSHEARSKGSLDPGKLPTRTTRGRVDRTPLIHLLTNKAFNATTFTNVAIAPPAWEQHPCLILLFIAHPGMAVKRLPLFMPRCALFYHRRPSTHKTTTTAPEFSGARYYPFLVDPPQSRPDQASSAVGQRRNNARTSTTGDHTLVTGPWSFTIPSPTSPRHSRDGRHSHMHVATATSTAPTASSPLRHSLRVLGTPERSRWLEGG